MEQLNVRPIGAERTLRLTWDELPEEGSAVASGSEGSAEPQASVAAASITLGMSRAR